MPTVPPDDSHAKSNGKAGQSLATSTWQAERDAKYAREAAARKTLLDYDCARILSCCSTLDRLNDSDAPDEHGIAEWSLALLSWVGGALEQMDNYGNRYEPRRKGVLTKGERAHVEMDRLPVPVSRFYRDKFDEYQKRIDKALTGYGWERPSPDIQRAQKIEVEEADFLRHWRQRMDRLTDPQTLAADRRSLKQRHHNDNGHDHAQRSHQQSTRQRLGNDWDAKPTAIEADLYRNIKHERDDQPENLVAELVPGEVCGVFIGSGGAGKGIALQTLCTSVASQKPVPFLGYAVNTHGFATFWTAEDRRRQLLNRQGRINKALGVEPSDVEGRLILRSHRLPDCMLWVESRPTELLLGLLADAKRLGTKLLTIDSASITVDDEINRLNVGMFLRWLDLQAEEIGCTIIVVLHTSRTSDETVERLASGSTAWVFQGRFALLLRKEVGDDDPSLTVAKINYSKPGLKIDLHWTDDGVLMAKPARGTVGHIEDNADAKIILAEITKAWESGDPLVAAAQSDRYLPKVMARLGRMSQKRAKLAMQHLRDLHKIGPGPKHKPGLRPILA